MIENSEDEKKKNIEIVIGNSKDLKISEVKDNLIFEVHNNDATKNGEIIVPENQRSDKD